jgi:hypothetical protein
VAFQMSNAKIEARLLIVVIATGILMPLSRPCFAQTNPPNPAAITGTSTGGVGFVTETGDSNGIGAQVGEWGIPYTGGFDGPPQPGAEPSGPSIWTVNIDVNDGGIVSFNYQIQSWDGGPYDWLTVQLATPTGTSDLVPHYGNPSSDWGFFYESPVVSATQDLSQWQNQSVSLLFSVQQDGYGDETQAIISGLAVRTCGVAPLSPVATDPATQLLDNGGIDTADLTPAMQTALSCFQSAVTSAGGSFTLNSAYRTPAYQSHLREVWDKWQLLQNNTQPECQDIRTQVQQEFNQHGLGASTVRPASPSGTHTQGIAFDARVSRVDPDATAQGCQLYRPFPTRDPVHFQLQ